jgi:hypothetical protein
MLAGVESAKTKLARAAKHLKTIRRCIAAYSASRPYKLTKTKGKKTKELTITREPPREVSILAGEMVYQMRSALDHLVFDLVKRNPNVTHLDPKWFEHCDFPLRASLKPGQQPPLPRRQFSSLPGISKQAFAFIEGVQPYYRKALVNSALAFLVELSNIDKHRHLNVVYTRVRWSQSIRFASGLRSRGHLALDRGAKLSAETGWNESDRPVYVRRSFRAFVAFKEKALGGAATLPADYLLDLILNQLQTVIIPEFEKLI